MTAKGDTTRELDQPELAEVSGGQVDKAPGEGLTDPEPISPFFFPCLF